MEVVTSSDILSGDLKTFVYEENFHNTEQLDNNLVEGIETAVMILHFADKLEEMTAEPANKEVDFKPEIVKNEEKNTEIHNEEIKTKIKTHKYTVFLPKKQRNALLKSSAIKTKKTKKTKKPKLKKATKWQGLNNAEVGFNLTLFPRPAKISELEGDIDNLFNKIEAEYEIFEKRSENFQAVLKLDENQSAYKNIRKDRHRRVQKAHKQIKTKYCRSVKNNKGRKKLYVKHRVWARTSIVASSRTYLPQPKPWKYVRDVIRESSKSKGCWQNTNGRAPVQNLAFALDTHNSAEKYETNVLSMLINLQHRELTPEDYEILSLLDNSVAPKTVSEIKIASFKTEKVGDSLLCKTCSVCLEEYMLGQSFKLLPCGHEFHTNCIDMWLSNSSMNCPLDGIPVDD